jgi:polyphosphate kinase
MGRNLYERCEVVFPVQEPELKRRLREEILEAYLRDNVKARLLKADGSYVRAPRGGSAFSAQDWLMQLSHAQTQTSTTSSNPAPAGSTPAAPRAPRKAAAR